MGRTRKIGRRRNFKRDATPMLVEKRTLLPKAAAFPLGCSTVPVPHRDCSRLAKLAGNAYLGRMLKAFDFCNTDSGLEMVTMRWGMPPPRTGGPPVTNIRNTSSPHWRGSGTPSDLFRRGPRPPPQR